MQQCGRCGWLLRGDPRFCTLCSDGIADPGRVQELLDGVRDGSVEALRILGEIGDPAAFDVLVELASSTNPYLRRAAVSSLGHVGDERALPVLLACADDPEDMVVGAVVESLADLGGDEARAAIARLATRPSSRKRASEALTWIDMPRTVDDIIEHLADPTFWRNGRTRAAWVATLSATDDTRSLDALVELFEQVRDHPRFPPNDIVIAVASMTVPERESVLRAWAQQDGPIGGLAGGFVDRLAEADAAATPESPDVGEAARQVPRWSMHPRPVDAPITDPVTKFGGQPVWLGEPQWPISASFGLPMTFFAQFLLPGSIVGDGSWMAYLFLAAEGNSFSWDGGDNALIVQPGPATLSIETIPQATGPTYATELWDHDRFRRPRRMVRQEYAVDLTPGLDPESWSDGVTEDGHADWIKIGGTPRWLQGAEDPDGRTFAFQFTPSAFGRELGDGAEAYGFVGGDGRGAFLWQCH